ncbi:hypothetical protein IGI80_002396 [Enterococcus sp. DIV1420a]
MTTNIIMPCKMFCFNKLAANKKTQPVFSSRVFSDDIIQDELSYLYNNIKNDAPQQTA